MKRVKWSRKIIISQISGLHFRDIHTFPTKYSYLVSSGEKYNEFSLRFLKQLCLKSIQNKQFKRNTEKKWNVLARNSDLLFKQVHIYI